MGPLIIHKGRFLAAGTHFFHAGGLRGGPEKIYNFNFFEGSEKNWNFPKTPLNEKKIG